MKIVDFVKSTDFFLFAYVHTIDIWKQIFEYIMPFLNFWVFDDFETFEIEVSWPQHNRGRPPVTSIDLSIFYTDLLWPRLTSRLLKLTSNTSNDLKTAQDDLWWLIFSWVYPYRPFLLHQSQVWSHCISRDPYFRSVSCTPQRYQRKDQPWNSYQWNTVYNSTLSTSANHRYLQQILQITKNYWSHL